MPKKFISSLGKISILLSWTHLPIQIHIESIFTVYTCQPLKPAQVDWQNPEQLRFVLVEGKKRQIRRMCEAVGLKVTALKRVRIGQVRLGDLPQGQWRYLHADEGF